MPEGDAHTDDTADTGAPDGRPAAPGAQEPAIDTPADHGPGAPSLAGKAEAGAARAAEAGRAAEEAPAAGTAEPQDGLPDDTHRTTGDLAPRDGTPGRETTTGPAAEQQPPGDGTASDGGVKASGGAGGDPEYDAARRSAEEAAWAEIVADYGDEPPDPPGVAPWSSADARARATGGPAREIAPGKPDKTLGTAGGSGRETDEPPAEPAMALGGSVIFAPGIGPRDWSPAEPSDDDFDASDEGHFVPPEPPPLPHADTTARFAWLAVFGGPLLLLLMVVLRQEITWWIATLGVGGFLGGFATLVARMRDDEDEEDEDPGRGAVV